MSVNVKDLGTGLIFLGFGLGYGINAYLTMRVGTPLNMGPGFFPVALCFLLVAIGAVVLARGFILADGNGSGSGAIAWRAVSAITISLVLFGALVSMLGLLPGAFMIAFVTCLAKSGISLRTATLTSLGVAIFCALVFGLLLKLPLPLLGPVFFYGRG
ncbi:MULTISPECIES: tripartite tricarboxylate transporter TctB family protein [unclassified Chelatococcus]|uniref:tripartite tricarboxylate transporter TctB family protein n=1 Tax=unclassified Chelatococcus TaxID=2638111 RepID=UPI001BCBAD08|nr:MULTISPECIES: tripartite tricarboxylate transporter TctB family protein [unclassified Chelatococcus]MBS7743744.1 tripartite tricarboxylate transporter TctB family protein [Chelatococcus sp. HY11]MBX3547254.1 tripartite tricarboxylate transporter TctB family protein [Chelatococcus sp.]CAH1664837.1 putative Uncharacterized 16.3 kDa protein in TAR-I ttuC' 3'region [Hyphomicrobiales bacterium]CAH1688529.1 putative Uncharacterized 16.3 kDa protein in TAR-I ttuC' 3'region [Hyphomicrobiales bacteri